MKAQIFVAEDDNYLRDLYVQLLQQEGYEVESAADGEDALAKLRTKPYDLIFLDVMMPKLDGIEVLEKLHAEPPTHTMGQIILMTNLNVESVVSRAMTLGAHSYLIKSDLNPAEFLKHVTAFLSPKKASQT